MKLLNAFLVATFSTLMMTSIAVAEEGSDTTAHEDVVLDKIAEVLPGIYFKMEGENQGIEEGELTWKVSTAR